eukprot:331134_1
MSRNIWLLLLVSLHATFGDSHSESRQSLDEPCICPICPTTALPTTALPTTGLPTTSLPTTALPTTALPTLACTSAGLHYQHQHVHQLDGNVKMDQPLILEQKQPQNIVLIQQVV